MNNTRMRDAIMELSEVHGCGGWSWYDVTGGQLVAMKTLNADHTHKVLLVRAWVTECRGVAEVLETIEARSYPQQRDHYDALCKTLDDRVDN